MIHEVYPYNNFDFVNNLVKRMINAGVPPKEAYQKYFVTVEGLAERIRGSGNYGLAAKTAWSAEMTAWTGHYNIKLTSFERIIPVRDFNGRELLNGLFEGYLNSMEKFGEEYIHKILKRETGSIWNLSPEEFFALDWQHNYLNNFFKLKDAKIFQAKVDHIEAYENVFLLSDFSLEEIENGVVFFNEGRHGLELATYKQSVPKKAEVAYAIVALMNEQWLLATAYPGRYTESVKLFPETGIIELWQLKVPFAVKSYSAPTEKVRYEEMQ